jgi:hypothetical protein
MPTLDAKVLHFDYSNEQIRWRNVTEGCDSIGMYDAFKYPDNVVDCYIDNNMNAVLEVGYPAINGRITIELMEPDCSCNLVVEFGSHKYTGKTSTIRGHYNSKELNIGGLSCCVIELSIGCIPVIGKKIIDISVLVIPVCFNQFGSLRGNEMWCNGIVVLRESSTGFCHKLGTIRMESEVYKGSKILHDNSHRYIIGCQGETPGKGLH